MDLRDAAEERLFAALLREAPVLTEDIATACEERIETYQRWRDRGEGARLRTSVRVILDHFACSGTRTDLAAELMDIGSQRAVQGLPLEAIPTSWLIITNHVWQWLARQISPGDALDLTDVWSDFMRYVNDSAGAIQQSYVQASSEAYAADVIMAREDLDRLVDTTSAEQSAAELTRLGFDEAAYRVLLCGTVARGQLLAGNRTSGFKRLLTAVPALAGRRVLPWTVAKDVGVMLVPVQLPERQLEKTVGREVDDLGVVLSRPMDRATLVGEAVQRCLPLLGLTGAERPFISVASLTLVEIAAAKATISFDELPPWLVRFETDDHAKDGRWAETLSALVDSGMNIGDAAQRLFVHPNTVYYRLDAIRKACGVDVRDPRIVADYLLAAELLHRA